MRSVFVAILLASSVSACATVSMVASEAMVETNLTKQDSSLRNVSDAYTDMAEREKWVAKSGGIFDFARVLMDGASDTEEGANPYAQQLQSDAITVTDKLDLIREDIEGAAHGLDVATMEVEKLFEADLSAKTLRADLVSYESALVTAKKARRTFVETLAELDTDSVNTASYALSELDASIDRARNAADKLATYAADRKTAESLS
ncbi:MAG: hypothetical protein AAFP81_08440 [Pseudomonadota bacterium]